jgi:AraC-like DNA-binding protein
LTQGHPRPPKGSPRARRGTSDTFGRVRRAATIAEYVERPFGAYFSGSTFLHFFAEETLCGTLFWGRPDERAIHDLTRALEAELPTRSPPHRAFVDATRLTSVDPAAFHALAAFVGPRAEEFGRNVTAHAIARPPGVLGALVAGFYEVTPSWQSERTRFFDEPRAALDALGYSRADELLATLDAAQARASGTPPEVRALHAFVQAHPRGVTIAAAARALNLAPRAMQETLRGLGTTFRREVNVARVRAAETLLADSDTKLSVIAAEVGCASVQHFSTLFRKQTGQAPSAWRARHRG